LSLSRLSGA